MADPRDVQYEWAVKAHKNFFLRNSKIRQVHGIMKRFRDDYHRITESNPFQCNVTGFPSFTRIFLLRKMVEFNLSQSSKAVYVTFQLDNCILMTRIRPERVKRGNIYVYDIGTYEEIQQIMNRICSYIHPVVIVRAMRAARRAGRSVTQQSIDYFDGQRNRMYEPQDVDFLNRFTFLWDCEVARLLQIPATTGDAERDTKEQLFCNLPIGLGISSIHFFVEQRNYDLNYYLTKTNRYHLFTGEASEREDAVKNIMHHRMFHSPEELFEELAYEFGEESSN